VIALIDTDCYLNAAAWEKETLKEACNRFDEIIEESMAEVFATDWIGAIGGPTNFRETVFEDYKKSVSREAARDKRQSWFPELKEYVANLDNVVVTEDCEADDYLAEWAVQLSRQNIDRCIITTDKYLITVGGKMYSPAVKKYLGKESMFHDIAPPEAFRFFCTQMIMGDSVDSVPGIPGMGPVKTERYLEQFSTFDLAAAVKRIYDLAYGLESKDYFLINGKLLHMRRSPQDWFTEEVFMRAWEEAVDYERQSG